MSFATQIDHQIDYIKQQYFNGRMSLEQAQSMMNELARINTIDTYAGTINTYYGGENTYPNTQQLQKQSEYSENESRKKAEEKKKDDLESLIAEYYHKN